MDSSGRFAPHELKLSDGPDFVASDFSIGIVGESSAGARSEVATDENDLNLERLEKRTVEQALRLHGYNISHAAKELGLTRAALYRRMEKHGL